MAMIIRKTDTFLMNVFTEIYGPRAAGELLGAFGRLFTYCAQKWGHTCAIEDLLLNRTAEKSRMDKIAESVDTGVKVSAEFAGIRDASSNLLRKEVVARALQLRIRSSDFPDRDEASLDAAMQSLTSDVTTQIINECLQKGQRKPFPANCFSLMTSSGAKGSMVNHSQVSCALGQQALEGRRVPRSIAGKSLPCFSPFDPTPRAGGFVSDRFLTGVRPQEYYFHCMAGREGLIDTAVKTARSGYLQRCLVKHLESLSVAYDGTVRHTDGSLVQFQYGGDGLDGLNTSFLDASDSTLKFLTENIKPLKEKLGTAERAQRANERKLVSDVHKLIKKTRYKVEKSPLDEIPLFSGCHCMSRRPKRSDLSQRHLLEENAFLPGLFRGVVVKAHKKKGRLDVRFDSDGVIVEGIPLNAPRASGGSTQLVYAMMPDPVSACLPPGLHFGAIAEGLRDKIDAYIKKDLDGLFKANREAMNVFEEVFFDKYMRSLCQPGENVGVIAAQGVGEPSTQMTLNTFHLAGHGAGNVTLGIPRLRELLMTASANIKTPTMRLPLRPGCSKDDADRLKAKYSKVKLIDVLRGADGIIARENLVRKGRDGRFASGKTAAKLSEEMKGTGTWLKEFVIVLRFLPMETVKREYDVSVDEIAKTIGEIFAPKLEDRLGTADRRAKAASRSMFDLLKPTRKNRMVAEKNRGKEKDGEQDDENSSGEEDEADDEGIGTPNQRNGISDKASETFDIRIVHKKNKPFMFKSCTCTKKIGAGAPTEITLTMYRPASERKFLLAELAVEVAREVVVKEIESIDRAYVIEKSDGPESVKFTLGLDGCNFFESWRHRSVVDENKIDSNDVYQVLQTYGVEAARAAIVKEVKSVFGVYGIEVDERHLGLIADNMTFDGGYKPFNRSGIASHHSPFLRMTFETSTTFLTSAALQGEEDALSSPSARLCVGQLLTSGTGAFDVLC